MRLAEVPEIDIDIESRVESAYKKAQRVFPCRSNRASQLGHPCERYLVYMRTAWEKQSLPSIVTEYIFEGGRMIEKHIAIPRLEKAGFTISNQGRDFEDKEHSITGHMDGILGDSEVTDGSPSAKYPLEIKGISPFQWVKIDSAEDMLLSKKPWVRAYPAQLQLYLFLSNKEVGLFYLINKLTYQGKPIWMALDYDFCEELLKKAKRINDHVANKTLPDRVNDFDVCAKCSYMHICLPDLRLMEGVTIMDDGEFELKVERHQELKSSKKEYEQLDSQIKKIVEGKDKLNCGRFFITGKWIEKTIPATQEKTTKYWMKKIVAIEPKEVTE